VAKYQQHSDVPLDDSAPSPPIGARASKDRLSLSDTIALVAGIVTVVGGITTLAWFDTPLKWSLAVVLATFLILAVWMTSKLRSRGAFTRHHWLHAFFVLGLVAGATALLLALFPGWINNTHVQTPVSQPPTNPAPNTDFKITLPATGVPLCTAVPGIGSIPPDRDLWIASRDSHGDYWLATKAHAEPSPKEWTTDRIEIGNSNTQEGHPQHLYAMLLDKESSTYVDEVLKQSQDGLHASEPPPRAVIVAEKVIERKADKNGC
jgi:hypothetical protein